MWGANRKVDLVGKMLALVWNISACLTFHSSSGTLSIRSSPLNLFLTSTRIISEAFVVAIEAMWEKQEFHIGNINIKVEFWLP